ncbi:putative NADH-flavin reductase [Nocardia alba]|uniref:Putative NADH-flavin reductase n=2 Tax=Nocardia alba TaxID=225051 RepID=A0A4R1FTA2_9NOCA|nr:NAD(P)H-binding protein [Nocardia alba]TCJ97480.1 putative NADH-flavin reductase [Nocardia alba]
MKLVVFGSTGMGGSAAVAAGLERGHDVTVLARSQASADKAPPGVRVVRGDALDPAAVARTLDGADAVIQYLGVGGLGDGKPNDFVPDATRVIIEEMRAHRIERLVCASNMGLPGSGAFLFRRVLVPLFARRLPPILDAKVVMEARLADSELAWTAVRLPALKAGAAKGTVKVDPTGRATGYAITCADAADFMLDSIEQRRHLRTAVGVSN